MITPTSTAVSGDRPVGPHGHATEDAGVTGPRRARAFITASIGFEIQIRQDADGSFSGAQRSTTSVM